VARQPAPPLAKPLVEPAALLLAPLRAKGQALPRPAQASWAQQESPAA